METRFKTRTTSTGCSIHAKKTTVAIASVSSPEQISSVTSMATRILEEAQKINNTPRFVLFGTGLSDVSQTNVENVSMLRKLATNGLRNSKGIKISNSNIVVGAHDLTILRFVPSMKVGELCKVDRKNVEETIECLLRKPPISYTNIAELPYEWAEHIENVESFEWVRTLWKKNQTELADDEFPFDLLSLCMYCKLASMAFRTTDLTQSVIKSIVTGVDGAVEAGLMSIFPNYGEAPSFSKFIEQFMFTETSPWGVTARGSIAASNARLVLKKMFEHTRACASVLSKCDLVLEFGDDVGPENERSSERLLVVQGGHDGHVARMLKDRIPMSASSVGARFEVVLSKQAPAEPTEGWVQTTNDDFRDVVQTLLLDTPDPANVELVRSKLAAYTALSSRYLLVQEETGSFSNLVSTFPPSAAAHITRELIIRNNFILVDSTMASVAIQPGTSVTCTFASFCPTMSKKLASDSFNTASIGNADLQTAQGSVDAIATSLIKSSIPLGVLVGVIGGIVKTDDGESHRVVFWKKSHNGNDEVVTLIPKLYMDIAFADYATGSRRLDPDELHKHAKVPYFAADTLFTVFESHALDGSNRNAYRIPLQEKLPFLAKDESNLYQSYSDSLVSGQRAAVGTELKLPPELSGSMRSFIIRESNNDRLTGIRVAWASKKIDNEGVYLIVSDNSVHEKVSY